MISQEKLPLALIKKANALFKQQCQYVKSVTDIADLPKQALPEYAFLGRSNVGKSSLLNALVYRKSLAHASKTPGRTRALNFFNLNHQLFLVDLPGYGYAKSARQEQVKWSDLIWQYLSSRKTLTQLFLLIDSRHGIKQNDFETIMTLNQLAISTQIILTKADKSSPLELRNIVKQTHEILQKQPVCHPRLWVASSIKSQGLEHIRSEIYAKTWPL